MTRREEYTLVLTMILLSPLFVVYICQTKLLIRTSRRYWDHAQPFLLPWTTCVRNRREMRSKARSPFVRLPGEMRNRIYELAMPTNRIIERSGCMQYQLKQLQGGPRGAISKNTHHRLECDKLQDCVKDYPSDFHRCPSGPRKLRGIVNMTQVCRALRVETLAHFHSRNSFAFSRQPYYHGSTALKHSWKWNYDMDRMYVMLLERCLKTRRAKLYRF